MSNKATKLEHLQKLAQRSKSEADALQTALDNASESIPTKVSDLTNDSGYQTAAQVEASVNAAAARAYKPGGTVAFANLPTADAAHLGYVYNISDAFTTTSGFVEGAGKKHPAGTDVGIVITSDADAETPTYGYNVMAGFVDLSGYVPTETGKGLSANDYTDADKAKVDALEFATDTEVDAMLDEVFGAAAET